MESTQRVKMLLDVVNARVSLPKIVEETVKGKKMQRINGSFELSLFGEQELGIFRNLIVRELQQEFPELNPPPDTPEPTIDDVKTIEVENENKETTKETE